MNFFQQIDALQLEGELTIVVKKSGDKMIASVRLANDQVTNKAALAIPPLLLKGTPEELDGGFFENIAAPIRETSGLLVNMDAHQKSVAALKTTNKPAGDKAELPPPAPVDMKQLNFDNAMKKVDELVNAKKFKDALAKLPSQTEYPDKIDAILAKKNEINNQALKGTMFETQTA